MAQPAAGGRGQGAGTAARRRSSTRCRRSAEITIKDLLTHVSGLGSGAMGNSDIEKVARKEGETLADLHSRGSAARRWSFSPGRAGPTAPAPASKRSAG